MSRIILASGSPRRKELLNQIGIEFEVIKSTCEENAKAELPGELVKILSMTKAADVAGKIEKEADDDVLIIGADTVVVCNGEILGKPKNEQDAFDMLKKLQGKTHSVFTGVTLISLRYGKELFHSFDAETKVKVSLMNDDEIRNYISSGEPMDKAGAYGIQGVFAKYIEEIEGDYYNVVGLPISRLYQELKIFL